ncbi:MAG: hypothetical protein FWG45_06955 [Oscillospiraceae bacterium]|nr:hypothetical protein [Oscillospiraceae bacterium]
MKRVKESLCLSFAAVLLAASFVMTSCNNNKVETPTMLDPSITVKAEPTTGGTPGVKPEITAAQAAYNALEETEILTEGAPMRPAEELFSVTGNDYADYGVNIEDAVSYVVMVEVISNHFIQLIIVEAREGKVGAVKAALLEHQSTLKDDAFYPQGAINAEQSIVGTQGDWAYLICYDGSAEVERELLEIIK